MYSGKAKFHLEKDGRFLLSEGRARLLRIIHEKGSLQAAADAMDMSYRHAWGTVKKINEAAGVDLVVSERGGRDSGRTGLTAAGEEVLAQWDARHGFVEMAARYGPKPALAADAVLFRGGDVLLVRRRFEPYKDMWVLPGGFMSAGETAEEAAARELHEESGVTASVTALVGVYSRPDRDPRHHTVSAAFLMDEGVGEPVGGDDAAEARFFPQDDLPPLGFDHEEIIVAARAVAVRAGKGKGGA